MVRFCIVIVLIIAAPVPLAHALSIKPLEVRSVHGDWTVRCMHERVDLAGCFIGTDAIVPDRYRAEVGLGIDRMNGSFRLSVSLSGSVGTVSGVVIQIGQGPPHQIGKFECVEGKYCSASIPLTTDLLRGLKAGKTAEIKLSRLLRKAIRVPVSLSGFTAAFNAVQQSRKPGRGGQLKGELSTPAFVSRLPQAAHVSAIEAYVADCAGGKWGLGPLTAWGALVRFRLQHATQNYTKSCINASKMTALECIH